MKTKPNFIPGDDGHTVSNMNVEGMPWYREDKPGCSGTAQNPDNNPPSWKESFQAMGAVWKASFLITAVYSLIIILVILFLIQLWS